MQMPQWGREALSKIRTKFGQVKEDLQNLTDAVAILETGWVAHYTDRDLEDLREHVKEITGKSERVISEAAKELSRQPSQSRPHNRSRPTNHDTPLWER